MSRKQKGVLSLYKKEDSTDTSPEEMSVSGGEEEVPVPPPKPAGAMAARSEKPMPVMQGVICEDPEGEMAHSMEEEKPHTSKYAQEAMVQYMEEEKPQTSQGAGEAMTAQQSEVNFLKSLRMKEPKFSEEHFEVQAGQDFAPMVSRSLEARRMQISQECINDMRNDIEKNLPEGVEVWHFALSYMLGLADRLAETDEGPEYRVNILTMAQNMSETLQMMKALVWFHLNAFKKYVLTPEALHYLSVVQKECVQGEFHIHPLMWVKRADEARLERLAPALEGVTRVFNVKLAEFAEDKRSVQMAALDQYTALQEAIEFCSYCIGENWNALLKHVLLNISYYLQEVVAMLNYMISRKLEMVPAMALDLHKGVPFHAVVESLERTTCSFYFSVENCMHACEVEKRTFDVCQLTGLKPLAQHLHRSVSHSYWKLFDTAQKLHPIVS